MRDFTHTAYQQYLSALKENIGTFLRFDEFLEASKEPKMFCLLRHDVDRKPHLALKMAKLEQSMGIKATYYFRMKKCSFRPKIIREISHMGHEVGYHYESLSDTNGDVNLALKDFEENLAKLREVATIKTCAMHGQPLKPYDNRDIWRIKENHEYLKNKLQILGEVYLDIDYTDIAYINDTGRNWTSGRANVRDKVYSSIKADFSSGKELLSYLSDSPHPKICFQIHPERWNNKTLGWAIQLMRDTAANTAKKLLKLLRKK
ncbi:MAG: hypothetical protein ACLFNU_10845 [Bacteroidales bacterium]